MSVRLFPNQCVGALIVWVSASLTFCKGLKIVWGNQGVLTTLSKISICLNCSLPKGVLNWPEKYSRLNKIQSRSWATSLGSHTIIIDIRKSHGISYTFHLNNITKEVDKILHQESNCHLVYRFYFIKIWFTVTLHLYLELCFYFILMGTDYKSKIL